MCTQRCAPVCAHSLGHRNSGNGERSSRPLKHMTIQFPHHWGLGSKEKGTGVTRQATTSVCHTHPSFYGWERPHSKLIGRTGPGVHCLGRQCLLADCYNQGLTVPWRLIARGQHSAAGHTGTQEAPSFTSPFWDVYSEPTHLKNGRWRSGHQGTLSTKIPMSHSTRLRGKGLPERALV